MALARTMASTASHTTPHAGTAVTSLRSVLVEEERFRTLGSDFLGRL
jgi:hypothetical protein